MSSLNPDESNKRLDYLLDKLKKETLSADEGAILKRILEDQKENAVKQGNFSLTLSFAFVLAGLVHYLSKYEQTKKNESDDARPIVKNVQLVIPSY